MLSVEQPFLRIVEALAGSGRVRSFSPGPSYVHARTIERIGERLRERLTELHGREPYLPGMEVTRAGVELGVAPALLEFVVKERAEAGELARDGEYVRLKSHTPKLGDDDAKLAGKIESACRKAPYGPPGVEELARRFGAKELLVKRVCAFLAHAGELVETAPGMFFHAEHVDRAREFVLGQLRGKGELDTQALKGFMVSAGGTSRKFLVPLLEHFDRTGLTRREGDRRVAGPQCPASCPPPHRQAPGPG